MRNLTLLILIICSFHAAAQKPRTQFNGFGHFEHYLEYSDQHSKIANFVIGEHDFFISSAINDKISFLGEYVIRYNSSSRTSFLPSIERSFLKFNYYKNHNIIVGKIHTPVNYWNDVYHHGRLFFPVIERPIAFSHLIPLHTLGIQFQGQNLGDKNFGYDIVYGNGVSSNDGLPDVWIPSLTAAFHLKPVNNIRIGASYYFTPIKNNFRGPHSGHLDPRNAEYSGPVYKGDVDFHLISASYAHFGKKFEVLNELTYNITKTDTLGAAGNIANFLYVGYRLGEKSVPFIHIDHMNINKKDLYTYPYRISKLALGYRYEFSPYVNLKMELDYQHYNRYTQISDHSSHGHINFKIQMAYGF